MQGDVVAWTPTNIEDIEVGDVVVFKSYIHWPGEKIVVHRVSEIKTTTSGKLLLETKGDANEWTDQAGPHQPEPYIREDHLMGKIVSVGQQPLKIPFIGYLGIWINQGFDMISQSSSSKESSSYLGIFAPLTISVVILVILLFVIPERAKTFKEKIRLYIFGHKPINLKKTLVFFIVAYIVFLSIIHCYAHDSVSSSIGIDNKSEDSGINFGRITPGTESFQKSLEVLNPSTMPVKGIIFGKGEMGQFVQTMTFQLERGDSDNAKVKAYASIDAKPGSYSGDVMVYSSPFWLIFPDEFIQDLLNWNAEGTVFILDLLSAIILTTLTMVMLISITFVGDKIAVLMLDRSWRHPSKIVINKRMRRRISSIKNRTSRTISRGMFWVTKLDFGEKYGNESKFSTYGKAIIASMLTLPILFFVTDQLSAMIIAVFITGLFAYSISCKIRRKIVLTVFITIVISMLHMIIQSNLVILSKELTFIEIMAYTLGTTGIYLLIFAIALIPLSIVSWLVTRLIRNVKERKDPLLSLEGSCDL